MKPLPAPTVPGNNEWERFDNAVEMLLNTPKQAFAKLETKLKREREKKRAEKKSPDGPACHAVFGVADFASLAKSVIT